MHTPGKWTVVELEQGWIDIRADDVNIVGQIHTVFPNAKDNVEHICHIHNSFDGLLEACKVALGELLKYQSTSRDTTRVVLKIRDTISKAENNN